MGNKCLVCSRFIEFFKNPKIVSIQNLFRSNFLSARSIRQFFIFFLIPVISFKPLLYKALKRSAPIQPLSAYTDPLSFLVSSATGVLSSTLPLVIFNSHYLTYIIDNHMQLELKKPTHRSFTFFCNLTKNFISFFSPTMAD